MIAAGDRPRGESEVFNIVQSLLEETKTIFPNADNEELKRIIEAAVNEVMEREN